VASVTKLFEFFLDVQAAELLRERLAERERLGAFAEHHVRHPFPHDVAAAVRPRVGHVLAVARGCAVGVARAARQAVHRDGRGPRVLVEHHVVTAGHLTGVMRAAAQEVDTRDRGVAPAAFRKMDQAVERVHAAALTVEQEQLEFRVGGAGGDRAPHQVELFARDGRRGDGRWCEGKCVAHSPLACALTISAYRRNSRACSASVVELCS
jgi:hypothetical protein